MTTQYLVNLGDVQLYFDAELRRCKPPGGAAGAGAGIVHFVSYGQEGGLLTENWDIGLAEFTAAQRERARLYKKVDD